MKRMVAKWGEPENAEQLFIKHEAHENDPTSKVRRLALAYSPSGTAGAPKEAAAAGETAAAVETQFARCAPVLAWWYGRWHPGYVLDAHGNSVTVFWEEYETVTVYKHVNVQNSVKNDESRPKMDTSDLWPVLDTQLQKKVVPHALHRSEVCWPGEYVQSPLASQR